MISIPTDSNSAKACGYNFLRKLDFELICSIVASRMLRNTKKKVIEKIISFIKYALKIKRKILLNETRNTQFISSYEQF